MKGIFYVVGLGPGDPDMLTIKAVKTINMADVIACPEKNSEPGIAYQVAKQACPDISKKEIMVLKFPMKMGDLSKEHQKVADQISDRLKSGKNVAFLTIGDPAIYSTFSYMMDKAKTDGICCKMISGVSAVSACAGRLGIPLSCGNEMIHIIPGIENLKEVLDYPGTKVIMKCGKNIAKVKQILKDYEERNLKSGIKIAIYAVSECGMIDEACYEGISNIPDDAGYMTTIIVKKAD